jgi:hypothetical protein
MYCIIITTGLNIHRLTTNALTGQGKDTERTQTNINGEKQIENFALRQTSVIDIRQGVTQAYVW